MIKKWNNTQEKKRLFMTGEKKFTYALKVSNPTYAWHCQE